MLITLCSFGSVMSSIFYILVALMALMFMIVVHEFGHYLAGKKLGFQINEFAIGFGPPIFKRKLKGGEQFSIRPVPLGGFCAFEGEDEEKDKDNPGAFNNKEPWKRLIVLFSGAFFNFLSAMIIISIFFSIYGTQVAVIGKLYPNGVAETQQTVREGDIILSVDGKTKHILMNEDFTDMFSKCGDTAEVRVLRDGKVLKFTIEKGAYDYVAPKATESFYQYLRIVDNAYYEPVTIYGTDKLLEINGKKVAKMDAEELAQAKTGIVSGSTVLFSRDEGGKVTEIECVVSIVRAGDRLNHIVNYTEITDDDTLVAIDGEAVSEMSENKLQRKLKDVEMGTSLTYSRKNADGTSKEFTCSVIVKPDGSKTYAVSNFLPALSDGEYLSLYETDALGNRFLKDGSELYYSQGVPVIVDGGTVLAFSGEILSDFGASYVSEEYRYTATNDGEGGIEAYNFGFTRSLTMEKLGFFRTLGRSFTYSFYIVFKILALLGGLLTGKTALSSAGGPITVISTVSQGLASGGLPYLIYIVCILSANVAVMNLLPLPALDGSKMVFTTIEWIRGKPINRKVEAIIHTVGLIALFSLTIFLDIFHLVS